MDWKRSNTPSQKSSPEWDKTSLEKAADNIIEVSAKKQTTLPIKMYVVAGLIGVGVYGAVLGGEYVVNNPDVLNGWRHSLENHFQQAITNHAPDDFAEVIKVKPYYLLAKRYDGKYELRTGGRAAWRYNNPGKLVHGNFTRKMGDLGSDGKLALFPSYGLGRRALEVLFFETNDFDYKKSTIKEAMAAFVPKSEYHDPVKYTAAVAKSVGAPPDTKMSDLDNEQRRNLLNEIENQELFIHGTTNVFNDQVDFELRGW